MQKLKALCDMVQSFCQASSLEFTADFPQSSQFAIQKFKDQDI